MPRTSRRRTSRPVRRKSDYSLVEVRPTESGVTASTCGSFEGSSRAAAIRGAREKAQRYETGEAVVALLDRKGKIFGVYGHNGRAMPHLVSKVRRYLRNMEHRTVEQLPELSQSESPLPSGEVQGAALPSEVKEETNAAVTSS